MCSILSITNCTTYLLLFYYKNSLDGKPINYLRGNNTFKINSRVT